MVSFSDLDTAFLKPCSRCGELLQDHERFCRFCGKDQSLPNMPPEQLDALLSARTASKAQPDPSAPAPSQPSAEHRPIPTLQEVSPSRRRSRPAPLQDADGDGGAQAAAASPPSSSFPLAPVASQPLTSPRESGFGFKTSQPSGAWLDELPSRRDARAAARSTRRLTGIVIVLASMLGGALWWEHRGDANAVSASVAPPDFKSQVALVEDALKRGDLRAATRGIEALRADHPGEAAVAGLQARLQDQTTERSAKLQALEDAARRASQSLGMRSSADAAGAAVIVAVPPGSTGSGAGQGAGATAAPARAAAQVVGQSQARPETRAEARGAGGVPSSSSVAASRADTRYTAPPPSSTPSPVPSANCTDALVALALCVRP